VSRTSSAQSNLSLFLERGPSSAADGEGELERQSSAPRAPDNADITLDESFGEGAMCLCLCLCLCVCVCVCVCDGVKSLNDVSFPVLFTSQSLNLRTPLPCSLLEFVSDEEDTEGDGYDHDKSVADLSTSLVINRDEFNQGGWGSL